MKWLGLWMGILLASIPAAKAADYLNWTELPPIPSELGVAGPYTGVHQDVLIVGGGANFPTPVWQTDKVWQDAIYSLPLKSENPKWIEAGKLPRPIGYGACVSVPEGVVCLGGNDAEKVYGDAFLMSLGEEGQVEIEPLPNLPMPLVYSAAVFSGGKIYLAGGTTEQGLESAQEGFWVMDWGKRDAWTELETWPGVPRAFHSLAAQSNGEQECIYLIGGRHINAEGETTFLKDVYEYNPVKKGGKWRQRADLPTPLAAGTAMASGQSHIFALSGADGSLFETADDLKDEHPGFPKKAYAYHTITNTWIEAGETPANQVTTHAVSWDGKMLLASGEVRPRVRTPNVWIIEPIASTVSFAMGNWVAIVLYLGGVMGIGFYFSKRNQNTDDFFRGGQRIPSWVAGLSIFATMLSSLTFIALPARAYATNWVYMLINAGIIICAPLVAYGVIPYFRKINVTSAYEFLEQRFNLAIRLFASACFVLFQIGRMAIVMYLPALALAAITPLSLEVCILLMGLMSIVYCTMGGLEAVVWTDALQAIVLLGGALLSFGILVSSLGGGWNEFVTVAAEDQKTRWANWDWSSTSYMTTAFWVMLFGGIGSQLIPYTSDQAVVQRYVSTASEEKARSALWLNAIMSAVATFLFFGLGTALYVYYKGQPEALDPTFKTDSIFPLFISRELPVGVAGIVIAAVFAAAQSTISTSMNSTSTALVTDFFRRFGYQASEEGYLRLARILTAVLGGLGTIFALVLAWGDIESAWKTFLTIIGFVMGPLCGLFMLGMFTRVGNSNGAIAGAVAGVTAVVWARYGTPMSGLLYAPLGIVASLGVGYLVSLVLPKASA